MASFGDAHRPLADCRRMTLLDLHEGQTAGIRGLRGEPALTRRIEALGFFAGSRIRFVRAAPFSGPLLVEEPASGVRIMIARDMAEAIEVERER